MWIKELEDLTHLKTFLVENLNFEETIGFSFCQISTGMELSEVPKILGEPDIYNTESDQQQTIQYNAWIDHPEYGKRDHYKLNILFWAFNREPFKIIKLHFDYHKTGDSVVPFRTFLSDFFESVIEKLGKPEKKTLRQGREEILYVQGKHKLEIWNNSEGVRIQIK